MVASSGYLSHSKFGMLVGHRHVVVLVHFQKSVDAVAEQSSELLDQDHTLMPYSVVRGLLAIERTHWLSWVALRCVLALHAHWKVSRPLVDPNCLATLLR